MAPKSKKSATKKKSVSQVTESSEALSAEVSDTPPETSSATDIPDESGASPSLGKRKCFEPSIAFTAEDIERLRLNEPEKLKVIQLREVFKAANWKGMNFPSPSSWDKETCQTNFRGKHEAILQMNVLETLMINEVKPSKVRKDTPLSKITHETYIQKVNIMKMPVPVKAKVAVFHGLEAEYVGKAILKDKDNDVAKIEFLSLEVKELSDMDDELSVGVEYNWPARMVCEYSMYKPDKIVTLQELKASQDPNFDLINNQSSEIKRLKGVIRQMNEEKESTSSSSSSNANEIRSMKLQSHVNAIQQQLNLLKSALGAELQRVVIWKGTAKKISDLEAANLSKNQGGVAVTQLLKLLIDKFKVLQPGKGYRFVKDTRNTHLDPIEEDLVQDLLKAIEVNCPVAFTKEPHKKREFLAKSLARLRKSCTFVKSETTPSLKKEAEVDLTIDSDE